jgi:hypothetical protein
LSNDGVKQIILVYLDGENIERDENPLKKLNDKGENVSFFFFCINDYSKTYRLYNPSTKKIIIIRDIIFCKAKF